MSIKAFLKFSKYFQSRKDDDIFDRANCQWTSNLLLVFSSLTAFKQFYDNPIECMTPPNFASSWSTVGFVWKILNYL